MIQLSSKGLCYLCGSEDVCFLLVAPLPERLATPRSRQ
jgi:hypothetical protein